MHYRKNVVELVVTFEIENIGKQTTSELRSSELFSFLRLTNIFTTTDRSTGLRSYSGIWIDQLLVLQIDNLLALAFESLVFVLTASKTCKDAFTARRIGLGKGVTYYILRDGTHAPLYPKSS